MPGEGVSGTAPNNSALAGGDGSRDKPELYDPFAATDSDTDSTSAKRDKMSKDKNDRSLKGSSHSQTKAQEEEESDEFSDLEPPPAPPAALLPGVNGTVAAASVASSGGKEQYDPLDPTADDGSPTAPAFTPVSQEEDDAQDTDISAPPFSPPSPGPVSAKVRFLPRSLHH